MQNYYQRSSAMEIEDLVFVGFNSRVIALDRNSGAEHWAWKAPKGRSQMVATMLDGDRLIVSVHGYMYALDPLTGETIWQNHLPGKGYGIPSLASARAHSTGTAAAAAAIYAQQQSS